MAVTLTITVTNAEAVRVAAACGDKLGLRNAQGTQRSATEAEVMADIRQYVKGYVRGYETGVAVTAAAAGVTDVEPT